MDNPAWCIDIDILGSDGEHCDASGSDWLNDHSSRSGKL